jgi:hypothetical protein
MSWLEGVLGPLPQAVKSRIPEDALRDVHSPYEEDRQLLLDRVRGLLGVYEDRPALAGAVKTGRSRELRSALQEINVELDNYTRRRGEVFAELVGVEPGVQRFRRKLSRWPLSEEEVMAFLEGKGPAPKELGRIAKRLARRYAWRERHAARFLLTGQAPQPISVAVVFSEITPPYVPKTARIIVTADVWVDAAEVGAVFRTAQRQILGGDNRKVSERVLEVASFVARRVREHGEGESWEDRWTAWKQRCRKAGRKGWDYRTHHGFRQAFERFVHPKYQRPTWTRRDTS